jgi:hypothetical protein
MSSNSDPISLGVIYLIRFGEPLGRLIAFLASLPMCVPENVRLYVIVKTRGEPYFLQQVNEEIRKSEHNICVTEVCDEGLDIGAYFLFSKTIEESLVLTMSSSSRFCEGVDFSRLISHFTDPKIGLVGAMASRESMRSSLEESRRHRINKWAKYLNIGGTNNSLIYLSIIFQRTPRKIFRSFPKFPNTHIRTTGLIIRRTLLLEIIERVPRTKLDTLVLESGYESLYRRLQRRGIQSKLYVDGRLLDPESSEATLTFRSLDSKVPFVFDHWWDHFHKCTPETKKLLIEATWGRG